MFRVGLPRWHFPLAKAGQSQLFMSVRKRARSAFERVDAEDRKFEGDYRNRFPIWGEDERTHYYRYRS